MTRWIGVAALAVAISPLLAAQDYKSFKGKKPDPLTIPDNGWINSKKPLTLEGLKGRVVWLEFSFIK